MPGFSVILKPDSVPPVCEIFESEATHEPPYPPSSEAHHDYSDGIENLSTTDVSSHSIESRHHERHIHTTIDLSNYEEEGRGLVSRVDPFHRLPPLWMRGVDAMTRIWIRLHSERDPSVTFHMSQTHDGDGEQHVSLTESDRIILIAKFQVDRHTLNEHDSDSDCDTETDEHYSDAGVLLSETNSLTDEKSDDWESFTSGEIDSGETFDGETNRMQDSPSKEQPESVVVINWESFEKLAAKLSIEEQGELFLRVLTELFESAEKLTSSEGDVAAGSDSGWSIWDYVPIVGSIRSLSVASSAVTHGDTRGFLINSTVGISGLALDLLTVSTGVAAITGAIKMGVHLGARELAKGVVKGMVTGAARSAAISGTIGAGVGGLRDGTAGAVQGGLRGVAGGLVSGSLTGGSKGAVLIGQGAATASGMTAATRGASGALAASAKAARAVKMTARLAQKMSQRKERAYGLLKEILQDAISVAG